MLGDCLYLARARDTVCDVRKDPTDEALIQEGHDRRRETQLLYGDCVHVVDEVEGWCLVDIPMQTRGHAERSIHPYRGWVSALALERSDRCRCSLSGLQGPKSREVVVKEAFSFIGRPYVWGGLSMAGIDCSGLVYQSFKNSGVVLPRDAIDQHAVMMNISWRELLPADVLFCTGITGKISHVMIWDGEQIIEATEQGKGVVRRLYFEEKFGVAMRYFQSYGARRLHFCRCTTYIV